MNLALPTLALLLGTVSVVAAEWEAYRWKNRLLIVFYSDCGLREAFDRTWSDQSAGMKERDLIVLRADAGLRKAWDLAPDANAAILVGKDGTEKARWKAVPTPEEVFQRIDAMPMRQSERR